MSTVNDFVKESILQFPLLFANRTDVLYHALCVLGNGHYWSEQGDIRASNYAHWVRDTDEAYLSEFLPSLSHDDASEQAKGLAKELCVQHNKRQDKLQAIVDNVDINMHLTGELKGDVYRQYPELLLMSMPDNVTDDWRAACEEMKPLLIERGWVF